MVYSVGFVTGGSDALVGMSANVNLPDIVVSESTFVIPAHTAILTLGTYNTKKFPQADYVSGSSSWKIYIDGTSRRSGSYAFGPLAIGGSSSGWLYTTQSGTTAASSKINTSNIFNSGNPTSRTAAITLTGFMNASNYISQMNWNGSFTGTGTVTLNAPPTFRVTDSGGAETTQLYFDKQFVYAGLTTASVKVANLSAKYGGTIESATLKIGNQTATRATDGTLSILLNAGGTFTPTITVTDSRGQTATKTLDPITVNVYNAPSVSFTVERTTQTGTPDDEGTYATIDATYNFTDVIADAMAPTMTVTDKDGVQTTPTVTWYSSRATDGTLSGSVTWASLSSGDTVYGLIPGLSTQYSYQVSITPRDTEGTGTPITQTLAGAFYTIDFLAGGHGIAFGQPASDVGFFCNMDAHFVDANSVMRALFDFVYPVGSYYETSDTAFNPNVTWGGTWEQVESGRFLQATTDTSKVGDTVNAGLPNITGSVQPAHGKSVWVETLGGSGAFYNYNYATNCGVLSYSSTAGGNNSIAFDASRSNSIYGNSTTVQPPSILVFIWHRTA